MLELHKLDRVGYFHNIPPQDSTGCCGFQVLDKRVSKVLEVQFSPCLKGDIIAWPWFKTEGDEKCAAAVCTIPGQPSVLMPSNSHHMPHLSYY